jgi:hypothetical protein
MNPCALGLPPKQEPNYWCLRRSANDFIFSCFNFSFRLPSALHFPWCNSSSGPRPPHFQGFAITVTTHSLGLLWMRDRSISDTYNTHKRQTSTPAAGFEPAIPASERTQTHASDRAVSCPVTDTM